MPVVSFDAASHRYAVDGRPVLYVSKILELAGLGVDYSAIPPAVLQHARDRGSHVDQCCDLFDEGDLDWASVHPEAVPYVRAWARFRERERFVSMVRQGVVYHPELDYAGMPDDFGTIGSTAVLVERKATAKLSDTYALQAALYGMPGIEWDGLPFRVERRLIVQVRKDGDYRLLDCDAEARRVGRDDFAAARAAVAVARWRLATNGAAR